MAAAFSTLVPVSHHTPGSTSVTTQRFSASLCHKARRDACESEGQARLGPCLLVPGLGLLVRGSVC